jgi:glucan 1,3-beta-glucosidase
VRLTAAEHNVLYQVNINKAENVFIGLQQGEPAYWQGKGNTLLAPAPWTNSLLKSDPDFSWCADDEVEVQPLHPPVQQRA